VAQDCARFLAGVGSLRQGRGRDQRGPGRRAAAPRSGGNSARHGVVLMHVAPAPAAVRLAEMPSAGRAVVYASVAGLAGCHATCDAGEEARLAGAARWALEPGAIGLSPHGSANL